MYVVLCCSLQCSVLCLVKKKLISNKTCITQGITTSDTVQNTGDNTDNLERLDLHQNCLYTDCLMIFNRL